MKMSIKKIHDDEWHMVIGPVALKVDHFGMEMLNLSLHQVLYHDGNLDELSGYQAILAQLSQLSAEGLQLVLQGLDSTDLMVLVNFIEQPALVKSIYSNLGPLLSKQIRSDLQNNVQVTGVQVKKAVRTIMLRVYELESAGLIELMGDEVEYI